MTQERQHIQIPTKISGETPVQYRRRLSATLAQKKPLKHDGEDFESWAENYGEKAVTIAYLGWRSRVGANISGDYQGISLEEGASMMDENEGSNSLFEALQKARGKEINMSRIMLFVDTTLRKLEHEGLQVRYKGEFKNWCIDLMAEARQLGPEAERLKTQTNQP